jgi:hypothetical protein
MDELPDELGSDGSSSSAPLVFLLFGGEYKECKAVKRLYLTMNLMYDTRAY